jgi:hypothetical protein
MITVAAVSAATSFDEYLSRVGQAAGIVHELRKGEQEDEEVRRVLKTVGQMLPATEDVQFGADVVHVDNSWLHQAMGELEGQTGASRQTQLENIARRLGALEQRLKEARDQKVVESSAESARLKQILARKEYQPEEQRESAVQRWMKKLLQFLSRFLSRFFSSGDPVKRTPGSATLNLVRLLIFIAAGAALLLGAIRLVRRWLNRAPRQKESEAREVLGELIEEDVTAEDLLKKATELARQGDYRAAIRRAYIALLYELERRGHLRLHRSKTNWDYLRALEREPSLYPSVAQLTGAYERVWYGQMAASPEDFASFVARYQEVVR